MYNILFIYIFSLKFSKNIFFSLKFSTGPLTHPCKVPRPHLDNSSINQLHQPTDHSSNNTTTVTTWPFLFSQINNRMYSTEQLLIP